MATRFRRNPDRCRCCRTPITRKRRALIGERASSSSGPAARSPDSEAAFELSECAGVSAVRRRRRGEPDLRRPARVAGDTVHLDIVDRLATWSSRRRRAAGCKPRQPSRSRFLPRHAGADVHIGRGHPSSPEARQRPRTTLSPTLALGDGEPYLALGTPGGDQQDQWIPHSFCAMCMPASTCRKPSTRPHGIRSISRPPFWPRAARPGVVVVEDRVPAGDHQGAPKPRTRGRGRPGLVRGKARRGLPRQGPDEGGRESARHARLCRGPMNPVAWARNVRDGTDAMSDDAPASPRKLLK